MSFDFLKATIVIGVLCLLSAVPAYAKGNLALVLKTGYTGEDESLVTTLMLEIKGAGYDIGSIDPVGLCDASVLDASKVALLVVPDSSALPAKAAPSVQAFLKGGGDIIALNTPMWKRPLIHVGDKWLTRDEYEKESAGVLPQHVLFDFTPDDIEDWQRASNELVSPTKAETIADGPAPGRRALHVLIPNLTSWDTFGAREIKDPFPDGNTLTVFSAKGGPDTTQLSIEWTEKDGSRWIAVVALTPEWRQYVLTPEDFRYWNSTPTRGFRGDKFRPQNAVAMSVGLAHTHTTAIGSGRFEYWLGPFGTAKLTAEQQEVLQAIDPPALDTLSPSYKLFDVNGVTELSVRGDQAIVSLGKKDKLSVPSVLRSPQPRPRGGGFDKGRTWRWIPLLEGRASGGDWRGTPATLTVHTSGDYKGGVWASFGIGDASWYKTDAARKIIRQVAERMHNGAFFLDAGANFYTYFEDQEITLGANVSIFQGKEFHPIKVLITLKDAVTGKVAVKREFSVPQTSGSTSRFSDQWKPESWPEKGFIATAELINGKKVIDRVVHEVNVWKPKTEKHFVTVKNGDFYLDGKRWRAHGINYMPSSGIGTEDGEYFEHYLSARSYDPEVFQRDLDHLKDIGFNAVSIFIYTGHEKAQNLVDLLRRLDALGMKADLSLRPGTPFDFEWPRIGDIIKHSRLAENDTVFAYDLAWEPSFGHQRDRVRWDGEWEKWIIERYGSVENAEGDWEFKLPRDENGEITNPTPEQVDTSGPWNVMVAAYRRFLDTVLYKKYGEARRLVRSVDPNHGVSFRMSEATNPTYRWDGRITYDFPYLAAAVDILAPEAYGRIGDWEKVRPGWFQFEWGRLFARQKPFMWKEMGCSTWDISRMENSERRFAFQEDFYKAFYRMLIENGCDGIFFWWYPGGFRVGENSDYGIINPDGTDRPVTKVIREHARKYLDGPDTKAVNYYFTVDRDQHPDGITGVYDKIGADFWKAAESGLTPGFKTPGTGSNSANCPLTAVGGGQYNGSNPLQYLDAAIDSVEILDASGNWVSVGKGDSVTVGAGKPVHARVEITNLGEAVLLSPKRHTAPGAVYLTVMSGEIAHLIPMPMLVGHLQTESLTDVMLAPQGVRERTDIVISFEARGRVRFGEKFALTLVPDKE